MSGGSMEYLYSKVQEAHFDRNTPLRRAFSKHLDKVATALKDIEWVDSGDCSPGDEEKAIHACLQPGAELETLISEAKVIYTKIGILLREPQR